MEDMERQIETPAEAMVLIQNYLRSREDPTPDDVRDKLWDFIEPGRFSPVNASVEAAEMIYARREELPPSLLEIGAQIATMCALCQFNGMGTAGTNRGNEMAATIRNMETVRSQYPERKLTTPEPKAEYVPPTEPQPE